MPSTAATLITTRLMASALAQLRVRIREPTIMRLLLVVVEHARKSLSRRVIQNV
jgi:hypothetical protein